MFRPHLINSVRPLVERFYVFHFYIFRIIYNENLEKITLRVSDFEKSAIDFVRRFRRNNYTFYSFLSTIFATLHFKIYKNHHITNQDLFSAK